MVSSVIRKGLLCRVLLPVSALTLIAGLLVGGTLSNVADARPADGNPDTECKLPGDLFAASVPAFACPTQDGYYGNFMFKKMDPAGFFDNKDDLEPTMMAIMAIGSRGQVAFTSPLTWDPGGARFALKSTVGLKPIEFIRSKGGSLCASDPSAIATLARVGYTLVAVGESPTVPGCDLVKLATDSYNAGTGGYGKTIDDTIWSVHLLSTQGGKGLVNPAKTISYLLSTNTLAGGGWSRNGSTIDIELTARTIMALSALGERGAFVQASLNAVVALQNGDGGFGGTGGSSCTIPSSLVNGLFRTHYELDSFGDLKKGPNGVGGLGGRMGLQYPQYWQAPTYGKGAPNDDRPFRNKDYEGRFMTCWKGIGAKGVGSEYVDGTPASELGKTLPTSTAVYYAYFSDPILSAGNSVVTTLGSTTTTAPSGTATNAVVANPSVTG